MRIYLIILFICCSSCNLDLFINEINDHDFKEFRYEVEGLHFDLEADANRSRNKKNINLLIYAYNNNELGQISLNIKDYTTSDTYRDMSDPILYEGENVYMEFSLRIEDSLYDYKSTQGKFLMLEDNNQWIKAEFEFEAIKYDKDDIPIDTVTIENGYLKITYSGSSSGSPSF